MGRAPRGRRSRGAPGRRGAGGPADRLGGQGAHPTLGRGHPGARVLRDQGPRLDGPPSPRRPRELAYDEPVASYWPAFAAAGKEHITVREMLSHRANLYDVQAVAHSAEDLLDHVGMEERLAAAKPQGAPGRPAYHASHLRLARVRARPRRHRQGNARARRRGARGAARRTGLEIGYPSRPPAEIVGASLRIYSTLGNAATPLLGWLPVTRAGFRALHAPASRASAGGPSRGSGRPRCRRSTARSAPTRSPASTSRSQSGHRSRRRALPLRADRRRARPGPDPGHGPRARRPNALAPGLPPRLRHGRPRPARPRALRLRGVRRLGRPGHRHLLRLRQQPHRPHHQRHRRPRDHPSQRGREGCAAHGARVDAWAKRIVGSHFNPSGKPKRAYSSESDARREAGRFGMTYYRCDVCNKFHLARAPRWAPAHIRREVSSASGSPGPAAASAARRRRRLPRSRRPRRWRRRTRERPARRSRS